MSQVAKWFRAMVNPGWQGTFETQPTSWRWIDMQRKTLLTSALALLVSAGGGYAIAQDAAPKSAPAAKAMPAAKGPQMGRGDMTDFMGGPGFGHPGFGRP